MQQKEQKRPQHYVSEALMKRLTAEIQNCLGVKRKYRDKKYPIAQMARDLKTNSRYLSEVLKKQFHMNYPSLINTYRVEEARKILSNPRYLRLNMQDVSDMVGFSNRQSFYSAFIRNCGCTPRQYRLEVLSALAEQEES